MLFPLLLTATEELLFLDDRPAYPSCCFVRAEFSGCFDRSTLEAAIRTALRQHPLLTARVARRGSQWIWVPVDNPQTVIGWMAKPTGDGLPPAKRIDLTEEIGIRFQVLLDVAASTLILQFHHAACDGVGIFQFLHDLLVAYASALSHSTNETDVTKPDPKRLARRGTFGLTMAERIGMVPLQIINLWEARQFVYRLPAPLIPYRAAPNNSSVPSSYPAAISARLTSEETAALRRTAKQLGVTINDLLLRDTFLACDEWRKLRGGHRSEDWLRMAVPMNLRKRHDHLRSAANVVSILCLDRGDADFDDPSSFLGGLHDEIARDQRRKMGFTFPLATALCRHLPGGLKKHIWADKCLTSTFLSNLGVMYEHSPLQSSSGLLVAGDMTLESLELLPPLRPYIAAGFAVGTYADRLWIALHYDPRPSTQAEAQDLMAILLQRIRSSIDLLR